MVTAVPVPAASGDWAPPEPVFLPAELEVLAVPEHYRLQRADGDLPANTSLRARTETFLLLPHGSGAQPLLRASYPPFTTRQVTPDPLPSPPQPPGLPGPRQRRRLFQEVPTESPPEKDGWAVRAVSLESAVSPDEPVARVLFHLRGPDWLPGQREHPGERDLPCVTLHAHHRGRVARGACRLQVGAAHRG